MPAGSVRFQSLATSEDVAAATAERILAAAEQAVAERGRFLLVLAGGRTPIMAYTLLVGKPAQWDRWSIFFGDERCLPPDHPERNSVAARHAFLDQVPIPPANIYPMPAEQGPVAAALSYQRTLSGSAFGKPAAVPRLPFDLVLLGMGEDGHTASLFPGHPVPDGPLVIPVLDAPKPPPKRVSLTPKALCAAHAMLVLVTGADKADALTAWRAGADLPVARVAALGAALVLVDRAAEGAALH